MSFRKFLLGYAILWIVFIVNVCVWEWNSLKNFQAEYEVESDKRVPDILDGNFVDVPEQVTTQAEEQMKVVEFVADSTMNILVNKVVTKASIVEEIEDNIYKDVATLTGVARTMNRYQLQLMQSDVLSVTDNNGNQIAPVDNNYVAGTYVKDDNLSQIAIDKVEVYVKHINGLVEFDQMSGIMRPDSNAYKAVKSSQESLKWIVSATDISFTKEETDNMQIFDEMHFACDVNIDLTKKANSNTGREYVVDESVSYRILYENVNGNWYIYSFQTK